MMADVHPSVRPIGLTTLYEPENALIDEGSYLKSADAKGSIVFIHGFNGHPERTWTYKHADADPPNHLNDPELPERPSKFRKLNPFRQESEGNSCVKKETYWPRHLLPQTVEKARVLTYGYDTAVHHRFGPPRNNNTIYDFAWEFLNCLSDARQLDALSRRPLLFIAHSLGGIITKEALRQANLKGAHQSCAHLHNIFLSTIGIIFFGTPHRGADPRGLLQHVAERAVRAAGFTVNQKVFETLLPNSERLKELLDEFPLLVSKMKWNIVCFREMHGMTVLGGKKVVDDVSSCLGDFNLEIVRDIESDHREMCRFSGLNEPRYAKVAAAIHRIVQPLLGELNEETRVEGSGTRSGARTPKPGLDGQTLSEAQYKAMIDRLRFEQMDTRLLTMKTAQTKTCRWMLNNKHYKDWLNAKNIKQHHGFFWIMGNPGTGKSIMMKFLFWDAKKTMKKSIIMSFFFTARGGDLEKSTHGLYRSLLLQLLERVPETRHILDIYGTSGFHTITENVGWTNEMLKDAFTRALGELGNQRILCYIDALDECPEEDVRDMISFFEELGEIEKVVEFCICFSSRYYPEITIGTGVQLAFDREQEHKNDIRLYIDTHLKIGTNTEAEDIKAKILLKSSNIFLWVTLVIPILNKAYDRGRIEALEKRLQEIPAELHALFLDILMRDNKNVDELLVCIQSILFAARAFKPDELWMAVKLGCEDPPNGSCNPAQMTAEVLRRFVLDASKGLAEITKFKEPTVQFIHESVRDFLLKEGGLQKLLPTMNNVEGQGHDTLKRICSVQISSIYTEQLMGEKDFRDSDSGLKTLLLQYAAAYICFHANSAQRLGLDQTTFLNTFDMEAWFQAQSRTGRSWGNRDLPRHLLYILGEYGCADLIRVHAERHKHFELQGGRFMYPLVAALYSGHRAAARAFVNLPQLPEETSTKLVQTKSHQTSKMNKGSFSKDRHLVSFLCEFGDVDILRAVLESSYVEAIRRTNIMQQCFDWASSEAILDVLMEFGISRHGLIEGIGQEEPLDPDKEPTISTFPHLELALKHYSRLTNNGFLWGHSKSLLSYAAEKGFDQIVKLCLKDLYDHDRRDALCSAILGRSNHSGRLAVIKILLDAGVDLRTAPESRPGLMFEAMRQSYNEEVVTLLLSKSSLDLEVKRGDLTLLLWAIRESRKTYVKMLLSAGADPMARSIDGTAALTLAVKLADLSSFRCILSNPKCEINARDNDGRTVLYWCASIKGNSGVAMASDLINREDVDPNSRDNSGQTALIRAVQSSNLDVVEVLLNSSTINPNLASSSSSTPLMIAFQGFLDSGRNQIFWEISRTLLLTGKVDPDCHNNGPTLLQTAEANGSVELVKLLECFYRCRERGQKDELENLEWQSVKLN